MSNVAESVKSLAAATPRVYTYDELVAERPESNRPCELRDGELLMSPTPSFFHQEIVFRLQRSLYDWVTSRHLGKVVSAPIDMVLSPHQVAQPDVVFVATARLGLIQRVIMGPADFVAEVLSLGGRTRDRIEKRDLYEQHGVKEYWIVDPEPETVEVLALEKGRYELVQRCRCGELAASRLLAGFEVATEYLFRGEPPLS